MQMAEKKYADYSSELMAEYEKFMNLDSVESEKIIYQLEKVAQKTNSKEWKLRAEYFKLELFGRNWKFYENDTEATETLLKKAFELLEKIKKADLPQLELMLRQKIIDYYWIYFKNYEAAFEQYAIQSERLKKISSNDVPEKAIYYFPIADAHYYFKDYANAILYYDKILEEQETVSNHGSQQHAKNGLGLCYRDAYNDLDRSDYYSLALMQVQYFGNEVELSNEIWNGIAEGNIGYNMFLREDYDQAIPLLKSSLEKMTKYDDYAYATGPAINLASIYLKQENNVEAKYYLDLAQDYFNKMPRNGMLPRIYEVWSRYYAATKNTKLSMAYMDSTLQANKAYEEEFNAILLLRMNQKESAKQQQELIREKEMRREMQMRLLTLSGGFIIISVLSALLFILYRRKREAYRGLVRKSQEWAQINREIVEPDLITEPQKQTLPPDDIDLLLMKDIEKLMSEEKLYADVALSVDLLAQKLGAKRHYVSIAINRCVNKSFNTFVNEYRIKEAVQLLSKTNSKALTIDAIAFDVGFNDRQNFYRVFKKMTGLSPAEFRENVIN